MKILLFASVAERVGAPELEISDIHSIQDLRRFLHDNYPNLTSTKYSIAVNKAIVHNENNLLQENDIVAILPPFSGG
jgi:sulfur-carrier protein